MGHYFLDIQYYTKRMLTKSWTMFLRNELYAPLLTTLLEELLCVQEVVTTFYIVTYHIKWVTTSWKNGIRTFFSYYN